MYCAEQISQVGALFGLAVDHIDEVRVGSAWMGRRYAVTCGADRFFVKIRSEWWPGQQAARVCARLRQLHHQGFPVPALRPTTAGEPFAIWEGHICECHEFVEGEHLPADALPMIGEAGGLLAELHARLSPTATATGDSPLLPEGCGFPHPHHVAFFAARVGSLASASVEATRLLDEVLSKLSRLDGSPSAPVSPGHGDYHPANLICAEGRVRAVVDCDLTQPLPPAYDLGYFLYRAATRPTRSDAGAGCMDEAKADVLLAGYDDHGGGHRVTRSDVAREVRRFALYDSLLAASNADDPFVFETWATDALALDRELSTWSGD